MSTNVDRKVIEIEPKEKTKTQINALCCYRGMSAQINEMLAMGCYTPQEIVECIKSKTRAGTVKAAAQKLKYHIANMSKNGGTISMNGPHIYCKDIFFPEKEEKPSE